jgi:hypothetical protein
VPDYSREEAEEILRRALSREEQDGISHDDLLAAAAEVGVEPGAVEQAAAELASERSRAEREGKVRSELRRDFWGRVGNLVGINALLLGIDWLTGPGWWVQWVALVSALLVANGAVRMLAPGEATIRRAEKRIDKRERKRLKRERKREWARGGRERRGDAEKQFERVVEEGVEALLRKAGDHLEQINRSSRGPQVRVADPDSARRRRDSSDPPPPHEVRRKRRDT